MALIGLVYELKPGSSLGLAKMFSLGIVPVFLISPVAGVYIDRWNKRKTMYTSEILRGLFTFLVPLVFFTWKNMGLVYCLIFLSFCAGRFFIPAKLALVPSLVDSESLFTANSLISLTATIAAVLGFGFGGMIVERWGIKTALYFDALTFFISFSCIFLMRVKEQAHFNPKDILTLGKDAINNVKNSFLTETKEGLRYIFKSQETRYAAKTQFMLFAAIGSLYTVFIVFIQNTLSTVTFDLGWLAVGSGAGIFAGSLLYGKFGSKLPIKKVVNATLLVSGLYLVAFVSLLRAHPLKLFAFFSCFFLGIIISPIIIAVNTLIHNESENKFWGRIFSSLEVVIHLAFILAMFIASYLAEWLNPFTIIVAVGIIITVFSFIRMIRQK